MTIYWYLGYEYIAEYKMVPVDFSIHYNVTVLAMNLQMILTVSTFLPLFEQTTF